MEISKPVRSHGHFAQSVEASRKQCNGPSGRHNDGDSQMRGNYFSGSLQRRNCIITNYYINSRKSLLNSLTYLLTYFSVLSFSHGRSQNGS